MKNLQKIFTTALILTVILVAILLTLLVLEVIDQEALIDALVKSVLVIAIFTLLSASISYLARGKNN